MQLSLSREEHAALARVLTAIRKQLQDVSDLFSTRYRRDSSIAEAAVKTLVSTTLLEHEFLHLDRSGEAAARESASDAQLKSWARSPS